jgi:lipoprotein-anchoring transpeptidase ErfK/SrfK
MKRLFALIALSVFAVLVVLSLSSPVSAAGPQWIVVNPGDTLFSIAMRNGTTVDALMRANNLPNANFVYSGQRLLVPLGNPVYGAPAPSNAAAPASAPAAPQPVSVVYYTVRPGDNLAGIASRYGVSVAAIAQANGLTDLNFVWYGQRLQIPGANNINGAVQPVQQPVSVQASPKPNNPAPAPAPAVNAASDGKWIDVNVSTQSVTAYEGSTPIKTVIVSTGLPRTPTVIGTFKVLRKYPAVHMVGGTPGIDYYDLPNVQWTMFFYQGYALHGTYWHNNFGHPMSHGCVNMTNADAKWFYDWAPVGTTVVTHR